MYLLFFFITFIAYASHPLPERQLSSPPPLVENSGELQQEKQHTIIPFLGRLEMRRQEAQERRQKNIFKRCYRSCKRKYNESELCKKVTHCGAGTLGISVIFAMIILL